MKKIVLGLVLTLASCGHLTPALADDTPACQTASMANSYILDKLPSVGIVTLSETQTQALISVIKKDTGSTHDTSTFLTAVVYSNPDSGLSLIVFFDKAGCKIASLVNDTVIVQSWLDGANKLVSAYFPTAAIDGAVKNS